MSGSGSGCSSPRQSAWGMAPRLDSHSDCRPYPAINSRLFGPLLRFPCCPVSYHLRELVFILQPSWSTKKVTSQRGYLHQDRHYLCKCYSAESRTPAGFLLFIPRGSICLISNKFPVDIHSVCLYLYLGLGWFVSILVPVWPQGSRLTTDFYFICLFFSYDWQGWWYYEQISQLPKISVSI